MSRYGRTLVIDDSRYVTGALKSILSMLIHHPQPERLTLALQPEVAGHPLVKSLKCTLRPVSFCPPSLRPAGLVRFLPSLFKNTLELAAFCRRERIEIVHVNDCHNLCGCLLKCLRPSLKLIYHVRLLPDSYLARIYPLLMSCVRFFSNLIFCNSQAVYQAVGQTPKKKLLYNGIRFDATYQPSQPVRRAICYLGNFLPGKGQDLAIHCLSCILQQLPEATLHFYGGWSMSPKSQEFKSECESLAHQCGVEKQVFFHGFQDDVPQALATCELLLNLSQSESFSRVCLEALAQRLPVVAGNSGGPAEILGDSQGGILVNNGDWREAAQACIQLLEQPLLRLQLAEAGYARARRLFDEGTQAQILLESYRLTDE